MTVLLLGFEPFLEFDENPTDLVVRRLHGTTSAGHSLVGVTLPVDYSKIGGGVRAGIEKTSPTLVLGFGLAAGRDKITPEKVALNYVNSKMKDNSGKSLEGVPIATDQPDALFTTIDVEGLVRELNKESIPASLSLSAGAYLCNYAMYVSLLEAKKSGFAAGFIHVPCHAEWVARSGKQQPSLPIDTLMRAAELSVAYILRNPKKPPVHSPL
jgi:pyroglutamyl-peptidase